MAKNMDKNIYRLQFSVDRKIIKNVFENEKTLMEQSFLRAAFTGERTPPDVEYYKKWEDWLKEFTAKLSATLVVKAYDNLNTGEIEFRIEVDTKKIQQKMSELIMQELRK